MTAIGSVLSLLLLLAAAAPVLAQGYFIPGDPKAGMQLFFEKGCGRCHAILGEGGRSAPDLARAPAGHLSAAELVAGMWNHAPVMWARMRSERVAPPRFSEAEMANLFAFLYSVRSLDEPGDAERGRKLLSERHCLDCHAIAGKGGRTAPDLKSWAAYRNPVSWIQAMWNHGLNMQAMMSRRGLGWPEFRDNDMGDLIAWIRTLAANPTPRMQLRPASAETGRRVFLEKGCPACHAVRGEGGARGPDLGSRPLPRTLGQFAGLMWNHAPAMWSSMRAQQVARPQFSNQQMADLIAYLFTARYFEPAGSVARGRHVFEDRGCAACHGDPQAAPTLARFRGNASPLPVAAALWNHGPLMLARMQQKQVTWPRFRAGEMVDLMEFLNAGAAATTALRAQAGGKP